MVISIPLTKTITIANLKEKIYLLTNIKEKNQKLICKGDILKNEQQFIDDTKLVEVMKVTVMGVGL